MSHEVESMFYYGQTPWHGLGTKVPEALTSEDALKAAGLDWNVIQVPLYAKVPGKQPDGTNATAMNEVDNRVANIRETDNKVLGVVSKKYQIVQNSEAFKFTDALLNDDVQYETAGSLYEGKRIWLMTRMPQKMILGDDIDNFVVFSNSHDGEAGVRVVVTPVRVVCQNTLRFAFQEARRSWTTVHVGRIRDRVKDAQLVLGFVHDYMSELNLWAEKFAQKKIDNEQFSKLVDELIPLPKVRTENAEHARSVLYSAWRADNLQNFCGTGWGAINAVSDFATHYWAKAPTEKQRERLFTRVLDGHDLLKKACEWLEEAA